jgi:ubiquinone/menaquinone biosynthesis C-methylase UbiE
MAKNTTHKLVKLNKSSYDKIAEQFSFSRNYVWPDLQVFQDYVNDGDKVLDLGCGNGRLVDLLKTKKIDYLGTDYSQGLIDCATKNYPDKKFEVQDALNLSLPENSFDVVLCVSVLNHIPKKFQQKFIENVYKVLKPGGLLLLSNWSMWNFKSKKSIWKINFRKLKFTKNVITKWRGNVNTVPLFYYAFTKGDIEKLLEGFDVSKNFYSRKGKDVGWMHGQNIITVAKK